MHAPPKLPQLQAPQPHLRAAGLQRTTSSRQLALPPCVQRWPDSPCGGCCPRHPPQQQVKLPALSQQHRQLERRQGTLPVLQRGLVMNGWVARVRTH